MTLLTPALLAAYRATHYTAGEGGERLVLRVDEPSPALRAAYARLGAREAAYLTACNPLSLPFPPEENARRMRALEEALDALGHPRLSGRGEDPAGTWPGEPSWLVFGLSLADARGLGERFGQNALLHAGADAVPRLVLLR